MTVDTSSDGDVAVFFIPLGSAHFRTASAWLVEAASHRAVPGDVIDRLELCLNEALANILSYAGPCALTEPIGLTFRRTVVGARQEAIVTVSDSGEAFDPTTAQAKSRPVSLATAEPGGHGLIIIRKFADSLEYSYRDHHNVLRFGVRWDPAT